MTYQKRLLEHLASYKKNVLKIETPGLFNYRGKEVEVQHILPIGDKWSNILESTRTQVKAYVETTPHVTLHRYFHHLNSSQALAFNLFYPYFDNGSVCSEVLLRALGQEGHITRWDFESIPFAEEETNVDVSWETSREIVTYCEVKLTESEFGKAVHDTRHLEKLRGIYNPVLQGNVNNDLLKPTVFFKYYQVVRYVWLIAKNDNARLIFLLPKTHQKLWNILSFILPQIKPNLRERISVIGMEDVIASLCTNTNSSKQLRKHAELLRCKYIMN
ncbi:MAG TPA: hypothetical protein VHT73_15940 [Thermodesulfobacteriota bacterium]|nr:hypothetical protein [Thermodesulfobacteriota bacterium]